MTNRHQKRSNRPKGKVEDESSDQLAELSRAIQDNPKKLIELWEDVRAAVRQRVFSGRRNRRG